MASGDREIHPSATELERFLLGEMEPRRAAPVIAHLLRGCDRCRQQMAPLASSMFSGPVGSDALSDIGAEYDFPVFKAFAAARRFATESALKKATAGNASPQPYLQELVVATPPASEILDPWQRCETLLERCRALRYSDHEGMVLLASLAVTLAERLDSSHDRRPEDIADLQAKAWSELGNAYRVSDDLTSSESALARALERSKQGSGDPMLLARLMDLTASLYIDQRRFDDANRLLDCVYAIYSREGDAPAAARALVSRGLSAGYAFQTEQAIELLSEGVRHIDARQDPKLLFAATHNLLWCLVDADRIEEASALLREARDLYTVHGERFDNLKAHWLEGRIAAGFGDDETAERAFFQVREGYKRADLLYDAALVSLHLAALWLRQGRTAEIRGLIDEMVAIFRSRNILREALGALLILQKALRRDQMTAALLQTVTLDLWRMERLPAKSSRPIV